MTTYVIRRLLYAVLTFFGITIATFALIHSVPGDPISFFIGRAGVTNIPLEIQAAIRHEFHLDEPLPVQYLYWLRGAVTFDFGPSIVDRRPVRERIAEKLPATVQLNFIAFLLAASIGIPIGLWSAKRSGHLVERASAVGFFLLYSLPSFWVALLLMQWLSVRFNLLPLFGMTSNDYSEMTPDTERFWSGQTQYPGSVSKFKATLQAAHKLGIKTKFVMRTEHEVAL